MSEEKKYPIKYAVWELKKRGGWADGYKDITLGFITSKCYVVESSIVYLPNGDTKILHKVVFPFKDINIEEFELDWQKGQKLFIGKKIVPSYDASGNPHPIDIVSNVYESYEEASQEAEAKNQKISENIILQISESPITPEFREKYESLKKQFAKQLTMWQTLEQLVTSETTDMKVSNETNVTEALQLLIRINYR